MKSRIFCSSFCVLIMLALLAGNRSFDSGPMPGQEVPDAIAKTLRGGDCYSTVATGSCEFTNDKVFCVSSNTLTCVKVTTYYTFSAVSNKGDKPDPESNKCCGASANGCLIVTTKKLQCGS